MKYYVVFNGPNPGIYDNWEDAKEQINFKGARYKSYPSSEAAAEAYRRESGDAAPADLGKLLSKASSRNLPTPGQPDYMTNPEVDLDAWAVDASCLGNPGKMEYQGVELMTGRTLFRVGPFDDATNNIGEFLAIVHAMALMDKQGKYHNIYSDSVSGMAWARTRKVKTQLKPTDRNHKVFELMARAVTWLNTHTFPAKVLKWQTDRWGEIPADFGRK
ncbi:MAG: ribonuclease H family protein [Muribaculaceae bacterium]|nr:ribonuclease H family protein [Muribaculaceae bacterium]